MHKTKVSHTNTMLNAYAQHKLYLTQKITLNAYVQNQS